MMNPEVILIFFASRQIGGGEAYFINLGNEAIAAGRRCVVVDYEDGYVAARIPGAERIIYDDRDGARFEEDCVAFIPLGAAFFLGGNLQLSSKSRVLFVSIHHNHAIQLGNWGWLLRRMGPAASGRLWPFLEPLRYSTIRKFYQGILARGGLVYCAPFQQVYDRQYLGLTIETPIICIPVVRTSCQVAASHPAGDAVVWVSRLVDEKAAIVEALIEAMKSIKPRRKLILVGDGPSAEELQRKAAFCGVELEMPGVISGEELDSFLEQRAFLCVGVGTSAVEMAKAGRPTLVAGLPEGSKGQFAWIHEIPEGDTVLTPFSLCPTVTIQEAADQLHDTNNWAIQAKACMNSAESRHRIQSSWSRLGVALGATTLSFDKAVELFRSNEQPFNLIRRLKSLLRGMSRRA